MDRLRFKELLKKADLSKKEFCTIIGLNYNTVNTWGSGNINIPLWVETWLNNYIKAKNYEGVKDKVLEIEGIE